MRLLHFLFGGLGADWVRPLDSTSPMGIHPNGISTSLMSRRRSLPRIKLRLLKVFCSIMVAGMRVSGVYSIKSFVFFTRDGDGRAVCKVGDLSSAEEDGDVSMSRESLNIPMGNSS